jgi:molybdate transport system regulatory protein
MPVLHFPIETGGHMKISARNILSGTVSALTSGAVNTEVVLGLPGGDTITATITNASAKSLGLAVGKSATALIKAYSVMVMMPSPGMRLSARNALAGKVTRISNAPVSTEVTIALRGGNEVHAVITHDAVGALALAAGSEVIAVFKASSVVLAVSA